MLLQAHFNGANKIVKFSNQLIFKQYEYNQELLYRNN